MNLKTPIVRDVAAVLLFLMLPLELLLALCVGLFVSIDEKSL
jgi:hypothetical protein